MSKFQCHYCFEIIEREDPDSCPHCRMEKCEDCGCWIKRDAGFCFSCGSLRPETKPSIGRTENIGNLHATGRRKKRLAEKAQKEPRKPDEFWRPVERLDQGDWVLREIMSGKEITSDDLDD